MSLFSWKLFYIKLVVLFKVVSFTCISYPEFLILYMDVKSENNFFKKLESNQLAWWQRLE